MIHFLGPMELLDSLVDLKSLLHLTENMKNALKLQ